MAADGSHGPKPWVKRTLSTVFVRVPLIDWPLVKRGMKTEFRASPGPLQVPQLWQVRTPRPVVAYAIDHQGGYEARLMQLESHWREPLGAISRESLEREGCQSLAEFRDYWMRREHRRFRPTRVVSVFRLRPATEEDLADFAQAAVETLYGDFPPGEYVVA